MCHAPSEAMKRSSSLRPFDRLGRFVCSSVWSACPLNHLHPHRLLDPTSPGSEVAAVQLRNSHSSASIKTRPICRTRFATVCTFGLRVRVRSLTELQVSTAPSLVSSVGHQFSRWTSLGRSCASSSVRKALNMKFYLSALPS